MVYEKITMSMSDGNLNVVHVWTPEQKSDVKLVVVLSHGMAEYAFRYENFAHVLTDEKIALVAEDHRGHGETAALAEKDGKGKFGYLCDADGFLKVVQDIHEEILMAKKTFPGKKVVLFGHSFGSFVSQCVMEKYGQELDGCVLCGTAGPRKLTMAFAKIMANLVCAFGGKKKKSNFISKVAFGPYNSKIKNPRTEFDWLSRDAAQVDRYIAHPWCGFVCTGEFYLELFKGLSLIHKKSMMSRIPKNLPVLFIAGTSDPVGDYGKTVIALEKIYEKNGLGDVELKLYENARHELLNETNHAEVETDVLSWLKKRF